MHEVHEKMNAIVPSFLRAQNMHFVHPEKREGDPATKMSIPTLICKKLTEDSMLALEYEIVSGQEDQQASAFYDCHNFQECTTSSGLEGSSSGYRTIYRLLKKWLGAAMRVPETGNRKAHPFHFESQHYLSASICL